MNLFQYEIPGLSYQLRLVLAEAAPNIVSHDDLVRLIWPGKAISPETNTRRVRGNIQKRYVSERPKPRHGLVLNNRAGVAGREIRFRRLAAPR